MDHVTKARAIAAYRAGQKVSAIARELGTSPAAVSAAAHGAGLPRRVDRRPPPLDRISRSVKDGRGLWLEAAEAQAIREAIMEKQGVTSVHH